MQEIMNSNHIGHQSVIQSNTSSMNVDHQGASSSSNPLLFTATIYTQDISQNNNGQQSLMSMQNRQQQSANESSQAMLTDLNPFISGTGVHINQQAQQSPSSSDQMMVSPNETKDSYRQKSFRAQLP